jgi:hypothetical protein
MRPASAQHLSFGDHMHQFDSSQQDSGTAKSLESQHGSRASLDRPMVAYPIPPGAPGASEVVVPFAGTARATTALDHPDWSLGLAC